jgi:pilus assembly protein Flp/PilA
MSRRNLSQIKATKVQKLVNRKTQNFAKTTNTKKGRKNMERIKNFFKDESGASAVEYGLLVALIAVIIIGAVSLLGTNLSTTFNSAATTIGS